MAGRRIRKPRDRAFFECLVNGEKGMYVGTVDAEAKDPNLSDDAIRVIYIPLKDVNEGFLERWKVKIRDKSLWEVTEAKYPGRKALIESSVTKGVKNRPGLFDTEIKAVQDCSGETPWFEENFQLQFEGNLAKQVSKKNDLRDRLGRSEVEKQGLKDESERKTGDSRKEESDSRSPEDRLGEL